MYYLQNRYAVMVITIMGIFIFSGYVSAQQNEIETVTVTGTRVNLGIEDEKAEIEMIPGGATLIDGETLRERNVTSLADMLRFAPGVWAVSDWGNDGIFFSSRGSNLDATDFDMNGIKLMQDGLPVTMADGNNHNRIVDPLASQYATVARGANAMTYGASTLGGAINFVSPTAHDLPIAEVFVNGGSHGLFNARATLAGVSDNVDGIVTLEGKTWNGYRDHNEQERKGIYTNFGWAISDRVTSRFYVTYLNNDQELPGSLTWAEFNSDIGLASPSAQSETGGNFQLDVQTWRFANKTTFELENNNRLDIGFSYEQQSLFHPIVDRVLVDFDGSGPAAAVEVFSLLIDTDHENLGAMVRYNHNINNHNLLIGLNLGKYNEEGGQHRNLHGMHNGLRTLVDSESSIIEAYAMDRWRMNDNWTATYGLQLVGASRDVMTTTVASGAVRNPSDDYTSVNPRAGLIYHLNDDSSLYTSISRTYEAPTNFELEDNVVGGDATLKAMRGVVIEAGSRGSQDLTSRSDWLWDLSLYYGWIDEEILSVEDPLAPGTSLATNIDNTTHAGVEAMFQYNHRLGETGQHSINSTLSLTLNEFSFDNDPIWGNNKLPAAPGHIIRGEVLYRHAKGFYFGPTFDVVGSRFADFANNYKVDSHALLGLRAGWNNDQWKVFGEIKNLFDDNYVVSHSVRDSATLADAILSPGEPLSAYFGLQWQY